MDVVTEGSTAPAAPGVDRGWRRLRAWSIGSLAGNMALVLTGALVRLTRSGLGCPTWPKCTATSLIPAEGGLHAGIEFGNRLLTFVLVVLAVGTFVAAVQVRQHGRPRHDLRRLAFWAALGIPAQAIIGGITVLTRLNPYVVASHLLVSAALIVVLVLLVRRAYQAEPDLTTRRGELLVRGTFWLVMLSVLLGTLVTGSAPHGGDADAVRTGFTLEIVAKAHAWSVWLLVGAAISTWVVTRSRKVLWLGAGILLQGLVGYLQYFNGLPVWIVALHMVGVAVITALAGNLVWGVRQHPSTPA